MEHKTNSKPEFYEAMRISLLSCRYAGLLPLSGLLQTDSALTRFNLKSCYTVVYAASILVTTISLVVQIHSYIMIESNSITPTFVLTFRGLNFITIAMLIRFCVNWKLMIGKIEAIEKCLPPLKGNGQVTYTIKQFAKGLFFLYAVDMLSLTVYLIRKAQQCEDKFTLKPYLMSIVGFFYQNIPFDYYSSAILWISTIQSTFIWMFTSLMVIVPSLYLIYRFQDFNRIFLESQKNFSKRGKPISWSELRTYYTRLMRLVNVIDRNFSAFVLLAYVSNIVFFMQKIFATLNRQFSREVKAENCLINIGDDWGSLVYEMLSHVLIAIRLIMNSFLAAHIHTLSRKPLDALHTLPSEAYDLEAQRFMDQVFHSKVCLTGCGLFNITLSSIMTTFATIMIYELMLVQYILVQ